LPAVIAAPMTSSELLPAGISSDVTCSVGCAAFQASTMPLPQASSSLLLLSQILIAPRAADAEEASAPLVPAPSVQAAVPPRASTVNALNTTLCRIFGDLLIMRS